MNKPWIALLTLCVLLVTLTACTPAIETDESTWVEQITLGTSSSTRGDTTSTVQPPATTTTTTTTSGTQSTTAPSSTTGTSAATTTTTTTVGTTVDTDLAVGYVNASTLNVRSAPSITAEIIGGLKHGEQVSVVGRSGDWYVISFAGVNAYVSAQYISSSPVA